MLTTPPVAQMLNEPYCAIDRTSFIGPKGRKRAKFSGCKCAVKIFPLKTRSGFMSTSAKKVPSAAAAAALR